MRKTLFCLALLLAMLPLAAQRGSMNLKRLERILRTHCENLEGRSGLWHADFAARGVIIISDVEANRMRIFTPIELESNMENEQLRRLLMANFHTALDAKYGLYEGYVISVYMHPLREMSEAQVVDALQQVVNLADNFGTTYSSTDIIFGDEPPAPLPLPKTKKRITRS